MSTPTVHGVPRTRLILAVVALFVPLIAVAASPWHSEAYLVFLALPPTLGGFLLGPRVAWLGAGLTALGAGIGTAVSPWPWAGALVMALACAGVAWGARRGALLLGTTATAPVALSLVTPPTITALGITVGDPITTARVLAVAGFVALGGLWTALVLTTLTRGLRVPTPHRETERAARRYAAVLIPLMTLGTVAAMIWLPNTHAWWVLLTVLVVLHPRYDRIRSHARARVIGTVAGGFAAALLVAVIPDERVLTVLGVLCGLAAAWADLARPYTQYSALLTLTIILLTSGTGDPFRTDLERIGATAVGAALVLAVVIPGRAWLERRETAQ